MSSYKREISKVHFWSDLMYLSTAMGTSEYDIWYSNNHQTQFILLTYLITVNGRTALSKLHSILEPRLHGYCLLVNLGKTCSKD